MKHFRKADEIETDRFAMNLSTPDFQMFHMPELPSKP